MTRAVVLLVGLLLLLAVPVAAQNITEFVPNPEVTSVQDGDWHTASTWSCTCIPGGTLGTDYVQINHAVTVSSSATAMAFATLYIPSGGSLTIDKSGSATTLTMTTADIAPTDLCSMTSNKCHYETGIVVDAGTFSVKGATKTTWVRLGAAVAASATTLTLTEAPTNWKSGDRIWLPDTREFSEGAQVDPYSELDVVTLTADCTTTTCAISAAGFVHPTARYAGGAIARYPFAANLTRNVVIVSANPAGNKGHVIFSGAATVDVEYVAIQDEGRTLFDQNLFDPTLNPSSFNVKGRYAFHFHGMIGAPPATVVGNVVERAAKWCYTIHRSTAPAAGGHTFSYNVGVDCGGVGIMTEEGNEKDNIITYNLMGLIRGDGGIGEDHFADPIPDHGRLGAGFFLKSPLNTVSHNVAAGCRRAGFTVFDRINGVEDNQRVFTEFNDNEAVRCGWGFYPWRMGKYGTPSYIRGLVSWHNVLGIFPYPTDSFYYDGFLHLNDPDFPHSGTTGFFGTDYDQRDTHIIDARVENAEIGIYAPYGTSGTSGVARDPNARLSYVVNPVFAGNVYDLQLYWNATAPPASQAAPAHVIVTNPTHSLAFPSTWHYRKSYSPANVNLRVPFVLQVECYQGNCTDNFFVLSSGPGATFSIADQEASATMLADGAYTGLLGCPDAVPRTNAECYAMYGVRTSDAFTPVVAAFRSKIDGKVSAFAGSGGKRHMRYRLSTAYTATELTDSSTVYKTSLRSLTGDMTGGVTIDDMQTFPHVAGSIVAWTHQNGSTEAGAILGHGSVTVNADGSITIAGLALKSAGTRLLLFPRGSTTATFSGTDTTTSGAWKTHGYGSIGANFDENTSSGSFLTAGAYWVRNAGALQAAGQFSAYGGLCTMDARAPEQLTATNPYGMTVDCGAGGMIATGAPWPAGAGGGSGFYNRTSDFSPVITEDALRIGLGNISTPTCLRVYLVDMNDGAGFGLRSTRIDVYEQTATAYTDTGGLGQPYEPGVLLDTQTVGSYHSGKYLAWLITGDVVLEFNTLAPFHYSTEDTGGFSLEALLLLDAAASCSP